MGNDGMMGWDGMWIGGIGIALIGILVVLTVAALFKYSTK